MAKKVEIKKWHLIAFGVVILVALIYRGYQAWYWPKAELNINGKIVKVLVAKTYERKLKGWSDRKDMGGYGGMLFIFQDYSRHPMVMRDMLFPLDMVWMNDGRVVDMAPNLPPESAGTPENMLKLYMSSKSANTVLELPSGTIAETGLKIGDKVEPAE